MAISYSLRAKHRDTFRLVPSGSIDPGDFTHLPTNIEGLAVFEGTPQNYDVYVRPAYTSSFLLLHSTIQEEYLYLRTLNPLVDGEGILSLALANKVIAIALISSNTNYPYTKADDIISLEVGAYASGIPAGELISPPTVDLYNSDDTLISSNISYLSEEYNTALPHIYKYTYTFSNEVDADYYFKATPGESNILPVISDTLSFDTSFPIIDSGPIFITSTAASASAPEETVSPSSTVLLIIPGSAVTDAGSGVKELYVQPFLQSTASSALYNGNASFKFLDSFGDWLIDATDATDLYIEFSNNTISFIEKIVTKSGDSIVTTDTSGSLANLATMTAYSYKIFKHSINTDIPSNWPSTFPAGGNLVQTVSLQQDLPTGFIKSSTDYIYGFFIAAADNAGNIQNSIADFGQDTIQYDATLSLAPGLSYQFKEGPTLSSNNIITNENSWYNASTAYIILQALSEENPSGDPDFQIQYSTDGAAWFNATPTGVGVSEFYVALLEGNQILQVRTYNLEGPTSPIYTIEYKWDKTDPEWNISASQVEAPVIGFNLARLEWTVAPVDVDPSALNETPSGIYKIEIYRAVKETNQYTLDYYEEHATKPSKKVGEVSPSDYTFTDNDFTNFSDEGTQIYLYWGVAVDIAGNKLASNISPLLCSTAGVQVEPLVPADVDGALRLEKTLINFDTGEPASSSEINDSILARYGISSPVEALVIKTRSLFSENLSDASGFLHITDTISGLSNVNSILNTVQDISKIKVSGSFYIINTHTYLQIINKAIISYTDSSIVFETGTTGPGGGGLVLTNIELTFQETPFLLGFSNLMYADDTGSYIDDTGAPSYINNLLDKGQPTLPFYVKPPTTSSFSGSTLTGITLASHLQNIYGPFLVQVAVDGEIYTSTTVPYGYLTLASTGTSSLDLSGGGAGLNTLDVTAFNTAISAGTFEVGLLLKPDQSYTFNMTPQQNKYYWKAQFNQELTNILSPDDINFNTILAADLIVGGTLRLETGLSIWSGDFVEGAPTGSGITMDTLGMRMFNTQLEETINLDSNTGDFTFGNGQNKLMFDATDGKLTLFGKLAQVSDELDSITYNYDFIGPYSASTTYSAGQIVEHLNDYWFWGYGTPGNGIDPRAPGLNETSGSLAVPWVIYASSGIQGEAGADGADGADGTDGVDGAAGTDGAAGAGSVFRGIWNANSTTYYATDTIDNRQDVVQGSDEEYYICKTTHSSVSSLNPVSNTSHWSTFGATFSSVATSLLLAEDATVTRSLTIGQTSSLNSTILDNSGNLHRSDVISGISGVNNAISAASSGSTIVVTGEYTDPISLETYTFTTKRLLSYTDTEITLEAGSTGPGSGGMVIIALILTFTEEFGGIIQSAGGTTGGLSYFTLDKSGITALKGSIGGIFLEENKLFTGTGVHGNSNTGFYIDNNSNFSLGNALVWNPSTNSLEITGSINLSDGTPVGTGMNWLGAWSSSIDYEVNDAVSYEGASWITVIPNSDVTPISSNSSWDVLTEQGASGADGADGADGTSASFDWENDTFTGWINYSGSGSATIVSNHYYSGTRSLKIGDNYGNDQAWYIHSTDIPYNPDRLYKMTVIAKQVSGTGLSYFGVAGRSSGGGWVNGSGSNSWSSQHYIAASGTQVPGAFTNYTGYFGLGGTSVTGGTNTNTIQSPSALHTNVRYFRPLILVNYEDSAGIIYIDSITIEDVTDSASLTLSGLPFDAPTSGDSGLFMDSTHLGYYSSSVVDGWATYMDSSGNFRLQNSTGNAFDWNGTRVLIGSDSGISGTGGIILGADGSATFTGNIISGAKITGGVISTTNDVVQLNNNSIFINEEPSDLTGSALMSNQSGTLGDGDGDTNDKSLSNLGSDRYITGNIFITPTQGMKYKIYLQVYRSSGVWHTVDLLFTTHLGAYSDPGATFYFAFQTESHNPSYRLHFVAVDGGDDDWDYGGS